MMEGDGEGEGDREENDDEETHSKSHGKISTVYVRDVRTQYWNNSVKVTQYSCIYVHAIMRPSYHYCLDFYSFTYKKFINFIFIYIFYFRFFIFIFIFFSIRVVKIEKKRKKSCPIFN